MSPEESEIKNVVDFDKEKLIHLARLNEQLSALLSLPIFGADSLLLRHYHLVALLLPTAFSSTGDFPSSATGQRPSD